MPRFGSMADAAMESEGKAPGGWAAAGGDSSLCCVERCFRRKKTFPPRNVTLVCGFVLCISNIFLQFMSTGGDTKHHPKYYQKPHLCENSYRFLFWHGIQTPFVLF